MNVLGGSQNAHIEQLNVSQVHGGYHFHAVQVTADSDKSLHEFLQPIEDASHTRDRKRSPPDSACTRGTRVGVVMKVTTWATSDISTDPDEPHILWMHGYVGCGKSAISQEVCDRSDRQGRPVVSFFFFRNAGDRSKIWRLATTLASQMATVIPETKPFILAAVQATPALTRPDEGGVSLVARMRRLVYMPFKVSVEGGGVKGLGQGPLLIVLDGLDECDDKEQVQELIEDLLLFFEENPSIPFRVFITSRVEQHIQSHLEVPGVRLENLVDHCSDSDISTFLEVLFANERRRNPVIRAYVRQHGEWPTVSDKEKLVKHIGGSFIFASSLFKYIMGLTAGDGSGSPTTPMDRLPLTLNMNPGLDGLYTQTLARSEHLPHFLHIISTIALLEEPLPTSGIAELLGISTYKVVDVLVNLQAIIQVPGTDDTPVTLCHTSLRDFLTTKSRSHRYFAQPQHHVRLFLRCLECEIEHHLFLRCLKCEIKYRRQNPGMLIPPNRSSLALEYVFKYSMSHLISGQSLFERPDWRLSIYLCRQTLELLSVTPRPRLDRVHDVTRTLAVLYWMMNFGSLPSDLRKTEGDSDWHALYHPKQLPTATAAGTAKREKPLDVELVHTLPHDSVVACVKFSPDGKFLATGSVRSAQMYNTKTGIKMCTLMHYDKDTRTRMQEDDMYVRCLSFSPCGKWLATGAEDSIIKIWDIAGKCVRTRLEGHQAGVYGLEFSMNGRLLVSGGGDRTVRVWDVGSALGNPASSLTRTSQSGDNIDKPIVLTTLDNSLEEMSDIDVDGDGLYLSNDSDRQAGDQTDVDHDNLESTATTYDVLPAISEHRYGITSIAVSADGRYVAAALDNIIRLWDLRQPAMESETPVLIERLKGHKDSVHDVSFAKNGQFLVSASLDKDLRVWDVTHLGIAPAPESLSSSSSLLKGAGNRNLANYGPVTDERDKRKSCCTMRLVGHWDYALAVAVSPDGRWAVSGSKDRGAMWWDLSVEDSSSSHGEPSTTSTVGVAAVTKRDREAVCRVYGHKNSVIRVDFSPVGNMWATANGDRKARIWSYKSI